MHTMVDILQTVVYTFGMPRIVTSAVFDKWLTGLKDCDGRARIVDRIDRLAAGHLGDVKSVGDGISELRMHTAQVIAFISCCRVRRSSCF